MFKLVIALSVSVVLGLLATWQFFLRPTDQSVLVQACEETIQKRLRSPSTYKRVQATDIQRDPATLEDYLYADDPARKTKELNADRADPKRAELSKTRRSIFESRPNDRVSLFIEYDAANAFGTPVREVVDCVIFLPSGESIAESKWLDPRVNGFTTSEWLIEGLRNPP